MKVAIASAHLGGVKRGVETWAAELARGLRDKGIDVTLFKGDGCAESPWERRIWALSVGSRANRAVRRMIPGCCWRWALTHDFSLAQRTFAFSLLPQLRSGFDIIHTQDTHVADVTCWAQQRRLHRAATVYGHGTGATLDYLSKLRFVQLLSPEQQEHAERAGIYCDTWTVIPNFVDVGRFVPSNQGLARQKLGIPGDARVLLSVGAIDHPMKRLDFLIRSFAHLAEAPGNERYHLLVAGQINGEPHSNAIVKLGQALLGPRFHFVANVPNEQMPEVYPAADLFTLCSLDEPFGIVLLEAAAAGIPCITADTPTFRWILGPNGVFVDMQNEIAFSAALRTLLDARQQLQKAAQGIRQHCVRHFSCDAVVDRTIEYYQQVLNANAR